MPAAPSDPSLTEETDEQSDALSEEKRRRNTAASGEPVTTVILVNDSCLYYFRVQQARFRIKRKQKTFNLERSVSDLTSRAEELEREATDLRRENKWLKEIVIMKAAARSTNGRQGNSGDNVAPSGTAKSDTGSSRGNGKGEGKI
jgi:hypothetical protein